MKEYEKLTPAKREADESAYKKGLKDGWEQAGWAFAGVCAVVYFAIQII